MAVEGVDISSHDPIYRKPIMCARGTTDTVITERKCIALIVDVYGQEAGAPVTGLEDKRRTFTT